MRTALHPYFIILFYFLISDEEEITVSLYLHQNDSILSVKKSNFVWQGKIKSSETWKFLECFLTSQKVVSFTAVFFSVVGRAGRGCHVTLLFVGSVAWHPKKRLRLRLRLRLQNSRFWTFECGPTVASRRSCSQKIRLFCSLRRLLKKLTIVRIC